MVVLDKDSSLICTGEQNILLVEVVCPQFVLGIVPEPSKFTPTERQQAVSVNGN